MKTSLAALRNPTFLRLWIASVISGTCVAAHDNATTYLMNTLVTSPFLVSLISTAAALPFLLFTLPAGALADKVNRKTLVWVINLWLALAAAVWAILAWAHLLNPCLVLCGVFLLGVGFAFNAPTWTSMVPEIVSDAELPSAATLSGLQLNISGIIGPALGGLLVPLIGANLVFLANSAGFLLVTASILQWKQPEAMSKAPAARHWSLANATRYLRCSRELQILLVRNFLFALFISAIPAVVPIFGLKVLHFNSSDLGLLFTSIGAGSVVAALFIIPRLRACFSPNALTVLANLITVVVYLLLGLIRQAELFLLVAALAGVGWTISASELWVAAQRAIPDRVRGRMNATIMMVSQGGMVVGGLIWSGLLAIISPGSTLFTAGGLILISLLLYVPLSINFTAGVSLTPSTLGQPKTCGDLS